MTTEHFSPYEMTTDELYSEVENVDFFGTPTNWENWCYEVLTERETCETKTVNFDTTKIEAEKQYVENCSAIRSTLIREIGQSTFYKIRNGLLSKMTTSDFEKCTDLADQLNSENSNFSLTHNITEQFRKNFSNDGYFLRDDIFNIINSIENLSDSKKIIAGLNTDISELITESMEYYESIQLSEVPTATEQNDLTTTAETIGNWFTEQAKATPQPQKTTVARVGVFERTPITPKQKQNLNPLSKLKTVINYIIIFNLQLRSNVLKNILNFSLFTLTFLLSRRILKSVLNFLEQGIPIMDNMFQMDDKSAKMMENMLLIAPKEFKVAAQRTLNNFAYDMRGNYRDKVGKKLTVRNKSLTRKAITYKPAVLAPVQAMKSIVGSENIENRFTGFGEQERQSKPIRKRLITKAGRGSWRRKLAKKNRMNQKFLNLSKVDGTAFRKTKSTGAESDSRKLAYAARLKRQGKLGKYGDSNIIITSERMFNGKMPKGMFFMYKSNRRKRGDTKAKGLKTLQYTPKNKAWLMPKKRLMLKNTAKEYFTSPIAGKRLRYNMYKQMEIMRKSPFK